MVPEIKAVPLESSDSELDEDDTVRERIEVMRELASLQAAADRFEGGIKTSESDSKGQSTSASLSAAEKKGMKEVEELERELDLKNTFSKETNRRDEDAEMNKYIDEQIRLRRESEKRKRQKLDDQRTTNEDESELSAIFTVPASATDKVDDILLHNLSKNLASESSEKGEAMLSSQMLNGIPEVDLGINERIRTIEATEEAKTRMASSSRNPSRNVPSNYVFQQRRSGDHKSNTSDVKIVKEPVVVVGEEPEAVEYKMPAASAGDRPPPRGKASDDYYLSKFKRNIRR